MKPKIKTGISAIMIIGWIFAGLGSVFLIMGILFLTQSGKEEAFKMLGLIFGGTGLFFFLIGVIFLILHYNNKSSLKKIVDNGYYIMAEISNIDMNYNVNVNMPLCDICQISEYEWLHPYISQPQHFLLSGGNDEK